MRVLMLLSQTEITGAEVYALQVAEELQKRGHRLFFISDTLTVKTDIPYFSRPIHPRGLWNRVSNIFFLRHFIKHHKIDLIHAHSRAAVRVASWACLGTKTALVSTVHGRQHFSWSKRVVNLYGQHIIAICENIKNHLIKDFDVAKRFITVIGNPLTEKNLPFVEKLPHQKKIALVGRTSGPKGLQSQFLIKEILPRLLMKFPDLKVDLLGGPLENFKDDTRQLIQDLNRKYPGCFQHRSPPHLEEAIENYDLVFGAGRIAIAALMRGVPLWAIGENSSLGLATARNFIEMCRSNFGDIGCKAQKEPLQEEKIYHELLDFFAAPPPELISRKQLQSMAIKEFGQRSILDRIEKIYKAAVFRQHCPRFLPILMYHQVTEDTLQTPHRIFITSENFEKQLASFQSWGFQSLTFSEINDFMEGRKPWVDFPRKALMLTFDDGYRNNLTHALPLLKKYNFKAVIYLLANHHLQSNTWDVGEVPETPLLSPAERQELASSGYFEVGSHGLEHRRLPEMGFHEAERQLEESKIFLEKEFGQKVISYAFTYGDRRDDLADLAFRIGYQFILNTDQGGFHLSAPTTSIFRVPIFPEDQGAKLRRKLQPWYRRYFYWTRKK